MKRAIPQEPTPDSHSSLPLAAESARQGFSGTHRRVRTSAAMLSLALSVGASGTLLSQTKGATAADVPIDSFLLAAALPSSGGSEASSAAQSAVYHTVQEGDSLWQIAQAHQVDVQVIKAANSIAPDEVLKVGQVLRVPAESHRALALESSPQANPDSLPFDAEPSVPTAEAGRSEALSASLAEVEQVETTWAESASPTAEALASSELTAPTEQSETLQASASTPQASLLAPTTAATDLEDAVSAAPAPGAEQSPAWVSRSVESVPTAPTSAAVEPDSSSPNVTQVAPTGIKTPQQIAALAERIERPAATAQPAVPVVPVADTYRVKPGDTLWTIASRYGLKPDALIEANSVQDPNLIVAGDVIEIPQNAAGPASVELASASEAVTAPEEDSSHRIARIRETRSQNLDRAELYERIREARHSLEAQRAAAKGAEVSTPSEQVAGTPNSMSSNGAVASSNNSSVNNLIADIRAMQRQRTVAIAVDEPVVQDLALSASATPAVAAAPETAAVGSTQLAAASGPLGQDGAASTPSATPANPEFAPNAAERQAPAPELLAAAPLSPEAYAPVTDTPTGRTVSPDMPILPASGEYLPEAPDRFNGYMWPAQGVLTSGYGWRWGRMHRGVDIAGPVGTPVYAAATGVVVRSGWNSGGYGNLVDVRHPDGSMTRYGHNSRLLVRAGQEVRQGQQIAEMGSTGYSTGPHLHFEVHLPGTGTVNPIAYLPSR